MSKTECCPPPPLPTCELTFLFSDVLIIPARHCGQKSWKISVCLSLAFHIQCRSDPVGSIVKILRKANQFSLLSLSSSSPKASVSMVRNWFPFPVLLPLKSVLKASAWMSLLRRVTLCSKPSSGSLPPPQVKANALPMVVRPPPPAPLSSLPLGPSAPGPWSSVLSFRHVRHALAIGPLLAVPSVCSALPPESCKDRPSPP